MSKTLTFALLSCLSVVLYFLILAGSYFLGSNVPTGIFIVVLAIFWTGLFVRRWGINGIRCRRPLNLTVGDLIAGLAEQRPDRSIRADELPYTQEEILEGVTEALCETLAVEPEEVTWDARIIKDLGAE